MEEDRRFDVGKSILGPQMDETIGIQSISNIRPNTELFRGTKQGITKGEASNLPCNSIVEHHFRICREGWWPSQPGEGWGSSQECSWALRRFIQNDEFTSHFTLRRIGLMWDSLTEKTNKMNRKEKEGRDQPSDFFFTFCLRIHAVVVKRMRQTTVHLWAVLVLLCICWNSSKGEIMSEAPFTTLLSPPSTSLFCSMSPLWMQQ